MKGIVSILHISDLHRSNGCEITNASLLASLVNDRDKYTSSEDPKIKAPDLIIVSGDVIRGSIKPDGSEEEVKEQYEEALKFLNDLATHFLDGDKKRLILIPGNHDIDWKFSRDSMAKIDKEAVFDANDKVKNHLLKDAINTNSKIRWNWRDLSFYEITSYEMYHKRLEAFSNFYSSFYGGGKQYSLDPTKQYDIFDLPIYNLTIVAFNSCYNNDHLRLVGDINPECIANASMDLREYRKIGRLILATWHHNTKGLPYDSNYMDNSKLKNFIDSGIAIGFHGHQHKTELIHAYNDVIDQKKIIVFSAGTLCGGPNELPVGNNRQYNLVEVDWGNPSDNVMNVQLHTREQSDSSSFENPIWKQGRIDSVLVSHHTVQISKPKQPDSGHLLIEVEQLMQDKDFNEAKQRLLNLDLNDDFVRAFLTECIIQTEDFELALKIFTDPKADGEMIAVLNAAKQTNNKIKMKELLEKANQFSSSNSLIKELTKQIEALLK